MLLSKISNMKSEDLHQQISFLVINNKVYSVCDSVSINL